MLLVVVLLVGVFILLFLCITWLVLLFILFLCSVGLLDGTLCLFALCELFGPVFCLCVSDKAFESLDGGLFALVFKPAVFPSFSRYVPFLLTEK